MFSIVGCTGGEPTQIEDKTGMYEMCYDGVVYIQKKGGYTNAFLSFDIFFFISLS